MLFVAELCKGSTADSDSVCLGSNPSSAATLSPEFYSGLNLYNYLLFWLQRSLVVRDLRDEEASSSFFVSYS